MPAFLPLVPVGIGIYEAVTIVTAACVTWAGISYVATKTPEAIAEGVSDVIHNANDHEQPGFDDAIEKSGKWLIYGVVGSLIYLIYKALSKRIK